MLSSDLLNKLSSKYENDNQNKFISNVLFSNPLSKLNNISQKNLNYNPVYNISVKPHLQVTNQKSSGRCWLFAALNVVRREMCDFYFNDLTFPRTSVSDMIKIANKYGFSLEGIKIEPPRYRNMTFDFTKKIKNFWEILHRNYPHISSEEVFSGIYHIILKKV